jgi:hypothetical protein
MGLILGLKRPGLEEGVLAVVLGFSMVLMARMRMGMGGLRMVVGNNSRHGSRRVHFCMMGVLEGKTRRGGGGLIVGSH